MCHGLLRGIGSDADQGFVLVPASQSKGMDGGDDPITRLIFNCGRKSWGLPPSFPIEAAGAGAVFRQKR